MTTLCICYATSDNVVARLHAFVLGADKGGVRDANHALELAARTSKTEGDVILHAPVAGSKILFSITLGIRNTRRGVSTYSGWDYRRHDGCPNNIAQAGMDIYHDIKHALRGAKNKKENK